MNKINLIVGGENVVVLVPDLLRGNQENLQALWLIAPEGFDANSWMEKTKTEEYAETAKAILVCTPWVKENAFYANALWDALHTEFTNLSTAPGSHRLLGLWDSAERCLNFVFSYPEKFCVAVAVCPVSHDQGANLLTKVKEYMAPEKPWPRTVIADCAEGEGKSLGEAINTYGVGLHVHAERPCSGWALMDAEIKSCLAHL